MGNSKAESETVEGFDSSGSYSTMIHSANAKCFKLRSMLANERIRVEQTADALAWNALDNLTELSKQLSDVLVELSKRKVE